MLEAEIPQVPRISTPRRSGLSIKQVSLFRVAVPLKKKIKHASHDRTMSENLVVRVELGDGHVGYGEGVPRPYVTGETIESTFAIARPVRLGRADRPARGLRRGSSAASSR